MQTDKILFVKLLQNNPGYDNIHSGIIRTYSPMATWNLTIANDKRIWSPFHSVNNQLQFQNKNNHSIVSTKVLNGFLYCDLGIRLHSILTATAHEALRLAVGLFTLHGTFTFLHLRNDNTESTIKHAEP
jgi:hypothetical protein